MTKQLLLGLLFLATSLNVLAQDHAREIDSVLKVYNSQGKLHGTVLVTQYGRVIFKKGYGYKNTVQKTRNDSNTIYQIGSVTKTFTSTMIMLLQKQGKLNVKDKLSKYFPDYEGGDRITLENLLTHTSGIFNYTDDSIFANNEMFTHHDRAAMMQLFKDKILLFTPGTKFEYSNSNYSILGYIIEDITKKSYYAALREMILIPLGMNHTGCNFAGLKSKDKATGYYSVDGDKGLPTPLVDSSVSFAAGCIYSTVGDMNKWAMAMMKNQLLTKEEWVTATTDFRENYGYGWMIGDIYGRKSVGHNGGIHGFVSNLFMTEDDASTIVLLSNDMNIDLAAIRRTLSAVLNNKDYELPIERFEMKMTAKELQEYVGEYELAPNFSIKVYMENGKLMGQATGQNPFQMFPARIDFFYIKVVDAQISFLRDNTTKKIDRMLLKQNGRTIPGIKKK